MLISEIVTQRIINRVSGRELLHYEILYAEIRVSMWDVLLTSAPKAVNVSMRTAV